MSMSSRIFAPYFGSALEKFLMALSWGSVSDTSDRVLKSKLEVYLDEWLGIAEVRRYVVTKTEFLLFIQDIVIENSDLAKVIT